MKVSYKWLQKYFDERTSPGDGSIVDKVETPVDQSHSHRDVYDTLQSALKGGGTFDGLAFMYSRKSGHLARVLKSDVGICVRYLNRDGFQEKSSDFNDFFHGLRQL